MTNIAKACAGNLRMSDAQCGERAAVARAELGRSVVPKSRPRPPPHIYSKTDRHGLSIHNAALVTTELSAPSDMPALLLESHGPFGAISASANDSRRCARLDSKRSRNKLECVCDKSRRFAAFFLTTPSSTPPPVSTS